MSANLVASPFTNPSPGAALAEIPAGEVVQSLTYRESRTPYAPPAPAGDSGGSLLGHAPYLLRSAAGGAWALVVITAAGGLIVLLLLAVVRVAGWLT